MPSNDYRYYRLKCHAARMASHPLAEEAHRNMAERYDQPPMTRGLSDRTPVGMWLDDIHPDDRDRVEAAVERAWPMGDGWYEAEYRLLGADEGERWVVTRGKTRFENGQPVSFLGVEVHIIERKMVAQGLRPITEMLDGQFAALESQRSPGMHRRVAEAAGKIADLSPRERDVLDGLVAGELHKQIAHRLGISVRTVELHRTRMLHRLGTPHLADAIRLAVLAELAA